MKRLEWISANSTSKTNKLAQNCLETWLTKEQWPLVYHNLNGMKLIIFHHLFFNLFLVS